MHVITSTHTVPRSYCLSLSPFSSPLSSYLSPFLFSSLFSALLFLFSFLLSSPLLHASFHPLSLCLSVCLSLVVDCSGLRRLLRCCNAGSAGHCHKPSLLTGLMRERWPFSSYLNISVPFPLPCLLAYVLYCIIPPLPSSYLPFLLFTHSHPLFFLSSLPFNCESFSFLLSIYRGKPLTPTPSSEGKCHKPPPSPPIPPTVGAGGCGSTSPFFFFLFHLFFFLLLAPPLLFLQLLLLPPPLPSSPPPSHPLTHPISMLCLCASTPVMGAQD